MTIREIIFDAIEYDDNVREKLTPEEKNEIIDKAEEGIKELIREKIMAEWSYYIGKDKEE